MFGLHPCPSLLPLRLRPRGCSGPARGLSLSATLSQYLGPHIQVTCLSCPQGQPGNRRGWCPLSSSHPRKRRSPGACPSAWQGSHPLIPRWEPVFGLVDVSFFTFLFGNDICFTEEPQGQHGGFPIPHTQRPPGLPLHVTEAQKAYSDQGWGAHMCFIQNLGRALLPLRSPRPSGGLSEATSYSVFTGLSQGIATTPHLCCPDRHPDPHPERHISRQGLDP